MSFASSSLCDPSSFKIASLLTVILRKRSLWIAWFCFFSGMEIPLLQIPGHTQPPQGRYFAVCIMRSAQNCLFRPWKFACGASGQCHEVFYPHVCHGDHIWRFSGQNNRIWGYFLRSTPEKPQPESSEAPSSSNGCSRKFELICQGIHQSQTKCSKLLISITLHKK